MSHFSQIPVFLYKPDQNSFRPLSIEPTLNVKLPDRIVIYSLSHTLNLIKTDNIDLKKDQNLLFYI
jgi:hypothetical protein